jgi:hypothetical protein
MRQALEIGHGRHQDNVLLADGQRPFKISKPIAHTNTHSNTQNNNDGNRKGKRIGAGAISATCRQARKTLLEPAETGGTGAGTVIQIWLSEKSKAFKVNSS